MFTAPKLYLKMKFVAVNYDGDVRSNPDIRTRSGVRICSYIRVFFHKVDSDEANNKVERTKKMFSVTVA